jgi:hypothetical protein
MLKYGSHATSGTDGGRSATFDWARADAAKTRMRLRPDNRVGDLRFFMTKRIDGGRLWL